MLTPISIQLGRAIRHKEVLPIFKVSTLDIALQALSTADRLGKPLVLYIDQDKLGNLPIAIGIYYLHLIIKQISIPVSLVFDLTKNDSLSSADINSTPNVSVLLNWDDAKRSRFKFNSNGIERIAVADSLPEVNVGQYLIHKYDVVSICESSQTFSYSTEIVNHLAKLNRALKIPILIQADHLPKWTYPKLVTAKVGGVILNDLLDRAYMAGLRTAIRNRNVTKPDEVNQKALIAVDDVIKNYLNHHFHDL